MLSFAHLVLLLPLGPASVLADFLTPRYPAPADLSSSNSSVSAAWLNISTTFDGHMNRSAPVALLTGAENLTFSVGLWSIHDPKAQIHQYHYASNETKNAKAGVTQPDADSIYRFASVSKLFTAYTGKVALTEEQWNRPLSVIFPNLTEVQDKYTSIEWTPLISQWDKITPLTLAAHLSGVIGNSPPFAIVDGYSAYLTALATDPSLAIDPTTYGLPPFDDALPSFNPSCPLPDTSCTADKYVYEARERAPTFQPWTSPSYSNHGYMLLGISIAALTGMPIGEVARLNVFEPLNMTSSSYTPSEDMVDRAVIPAGDPAILLYDAGVGTSSGAVLSTLSDLNKMAMGILNSTLISPDQTRRWMKPMAHTASPNFSVGAPWEIFRFTHPSGPSAGIASEIYCKLGDSGPNGGAVCLLPEYGAGFNLVVMSSDPFRSNYQGLVLDAIIKQLLPAFEAQAAAEGKKNVAGTYVSTDPKLNSTLTLEPSSSVPGLAISQWISNGTDVLAYQDRIFASIGGLRMLPTVAENGSGKYAFRIIKINNATTEALAQKVGIVNTMMESNYEWGLAGQRTYASIPINLALFDIDSAGEATAVELPAFKVKLQKE